MIQNPGQAGAQFEVTPEMVSEALAVFEENNWGPPVIEFSLSDVRDLIPEALERAFRLKSDRNARFPD